MIELPLTTLVTWGPEHAGKLAALWAAASPDESLSIAELERVVFADTGGARPNRSTKLSARKTSTGKRLRVSVPVLPPTMRFCPPLV